MILSEFERQGAVLCSALNREHYLQGAGLKPNLDLESIYADHRRLFEPEAFYALRTVELDERLGEKYRRFLLEFVAANHLEQGVSRRTAALALAEATGTLTWGGRELTYRSAPIAWANEPDADRRHALNERWRELVEATNPERAERHRALLELVPDLESGDYVELFDSLSGLDLARLTEQMRGLLADTADVYRDSLRDLLADHRLTIENAWRVDLAYALRGVEHDSLFPRERLLPTLIATLRLLGFDLEEQRNIVLDLEPRPTKSARAFCAPLDIPRDVRLILRPVGGHQDYDTLLHEAGHAEHFANVDPGLPFGFKWLGDSALTEGYAFLLQYLTTDRGWLRQVLGVADGEELRRFALFQKLQLLRRYATKLLYEPELWRTGEPERQAERYAELFTEHLLVRYFPQEYLADVDAGLYAAQYLRAWIFEAQLRDFLKREYDEEWFRVPKAGRFLRELWRDGQKYTADELVGFMGFAGLDPTLLVGEVLEALAR